MFATSHKNRWIRLLTLAALPLSMLLLTGCTETAPRTENSRYMFWPPAPDLPHIQFLTSISSSADVTQKQGKLDDFLYGADNSRGLPFARPYGIRMSDGKLYVCDASMGNVSVLDFRNKVVRVLGATGQIHLAKPIDIAVAPEGTKYISDTGYGAIMVYDADDKYAGKVAVKDMRPVAVAVHANQLYVCDIAASKVRIFDRFNGKELQTIGEPGGGNGKFGGAMGICIDKDGDVFVNDLIGCRVQKFSPDGKFVYAIGRTDGPGDHPGEFVRPKLMTVDSTGILYVVDNAFQNIQMFNDQGKLLMFFGAGGTHPGAMNSPAGVCVSDGDLDLFAQYVHPAFQAQRLIFVTNQTGSQKINVYAQGELKPGKTLADISGTRVKGIFGFDSQPPQPDVLELPGDATPLSTQPATAPDATPATGSATAPATDPAAPAATEPEGARPF